MIFNKNGLGAAGLEKEKKKKQHQGGESGEKDRPAAFPNKNNVYLNKQPLSDLAQKSGSWAGEMMF